ncbi:MAG: DNA primase [Deltaproteobacteria bacterium RBG_19FT_COMBO_43_11]|nr:MAG: DNA primase [Deltaproteobacteria bacterium RBG_19FT_COMBO_43_11]
MRFDDNKIEEIKSKVDIVELASEYLALKKAGRNFVGLCPFHQEKTASFTVNREKQIFYCFGCGEGGNVITFLMKIAGKSFPEAIKDLAEKTGVVLPPRLTSKEGREKDYLRESITNLNLRAAQQFSRNLFSPAGKEAREYLKKRGIAEETIKQFRLGYAPDNWRSLADYIEGSGQPLKLTEQAGLVIAGKDGGFYDRFRGRLIFPIENIFGEVVAFGGRILDKGEPKYLNSPESPVYIKGKNLYGLNKTKEEIRKKGFAIIVEGYFDLISLWNTGICNVVATLGTALTREHLGLLRRYTVDVVALFDSDVAGRKALDRSLELFLGMNMRARALILPGDFDPDDYLKKFGKDKLEELISHAQPLSDYYIENVLGGGKTFEDKREMIKTAMEFISKISDKKEKDLFIKRIAEKTGINEELLINETYKNETQRKPQRGKEKLQPNINNDLVEVHLIQLLLEYPQKTIQAENESILDYFLQPQLQVIGKKIIDTYKLLGFVDVGVILSADEDSSLRERIFQLMMKALPADDVMLEKIFTDNIRQIKKKWYKDQHRQIKLKLGKAQEDGNEELINKLLREKESLLTKEKELH